SFDCRLGYMAWRPKREKGCEPTKLEYKLSSAPFRSGRRETVLQTRGRMPPAPSHHYFADSGAAAGAAGPLIFQLYFFANFSTRPALSMNFIWPVKNGWPCEQISTCNFVAVLRVTNLVLPLQTTSTST